MEKIREDHSLVELVKITRVQNGPIEKQEDIKKAFLHFGIL